jgi:hypothetical protein
MVSRYSAATLGGSRLQSPGAQFEEAGQDLVPLGFDGLVWQTKLAIALTEQGPSGDRIGGDRHRGSCFDSSSVQSSRSRPQTCAVRSRLKIVLKCLLRVAATPGGPPARWVGGTHGIALRTTNTWRGRWYLERKCLNFSMCRKRGHEDSEDAPRRVRNARWRGALVPTCIASRPAHHLLEDW